MPYRDAGSRQTHNNMLLSSDYVLATSSCIFIFGEAMAVHVSIGQGFKLRSRVALGRVWRIENRAIDWDGFASVVRRALPALPSQLAFSSLSLPHGTREISLCKTWATATSQRPISLLILIRR